MRELPRVNIFEDFYMWFDLEEKKNIMQRHYTYIRLKEIELIQMMKQNSI